ncbi:MAG: Dabb family protein [Verrucomicrobiaceae bacterium]|nr:Dabb family protein [Verrucomicrobiaceae bacterium]
MNRFPLAAALALALLFSAGSSLRADESGPFRHFVSFQFKAGTSEDKIHEIVTGFLALKGKIDTITGLEWGGTENVEPRNDGFTHSFLVSFRDKAGLEVYLPHPAHQEFVKLLRPHLEKVYVFDYTAKQ